MARTRSLAFRATLALLLLLAFYALIVGSACGLVWLGLRTFTFAAGVEGRAAGYIFFGGIACFVGAAVLLWSALPRIDRFEPPGPELQPDDAPELFAAIRGVARAVDQREPEHVYLIDDVNAFVTHRGGMMGIGSARVMGIGLPLLELLTVSEMKAVLAHEFGHYHGGDTRLGPWIYKTHSAIGRTLVNLGEVSAMAEELRYEVIAWALIVFKTPFSLFGRLFLRITQAIRRGQERSADALAARTIGSPALVSGLDKLHAGGPTYQAFVADEVAPVVAAGFLPPLAEGFRHYLSAATGAGVLDEAVKRARAAAGDPLDSHPPLAERVAEVTRLACPAQDGDARPAIGLLADVAALETRLAPHVEGWPDSLRPISWEDSLHKVHERTWRREAHRASKLLAGLTLAALPRDPQAFGALLRKRVGDEYAGAYSGAELFDWSVSFVGACLCVFLLARGYQASSSPGQPLRLTGADGAVEPFAELARYMSGDTSNAEWATRIKGLNLAEVDFASLAAPRNTRGRSSGSPS